MNFGQIALNKSFSLSLFVNKVKKRLKSQRNRSTEEYLKMFKLFSNERVNNLRLFTFKSGP